MSPETRFQIWELFHPDTSIRRDRRMAGAREAIREGDCIFVSPAMAALIENAETPDELSHVLHNLPVRRRRPVLA